ncbi:hypothetical protein MMC10_009217 [Thelotrema lepadinum]|nr:hypothetical protein [Thelotrema lepadinum]
MNPLSAAPTAQAKAASSASALLGRTVHVKIKPRPRSLAESGQVLRILRRYGEVDVYKHLKYERSSPAPNTALAIYRNAEDASRATKAQTLSFTFGFPDQVVEVNRQTDGDPYGETPSLGSEPGVEANNGFSAEALWSQASLLSSFDPTAPPTPSIMTSKSPSSSNQPSPSDPGASAAEPGNHSPQYQQGDDYDPILPCPRPCVLTIRPSGLAHNAYIARGGYTGAFRTGASIKPGEALLGNDLPSGLQGMRNLDIFRGEIPLRVRKKDRRASGGLIGKEGKDGGPGRDEKDTGFGRILTT